jgi:hypothetical protein
VRVHLVNPSDVSFGTAVITPRWLYVLTSATPASLGDPVLRDETLETVDPDGIQAGDDAGIGITLPTLSAATQSGKWHELAARMWCLEGFTRRCTRMKLTNSVVLTPCEGRW